MGLTTIQKDCNIIFKYAKENDTFFIDENIILGILDNNKERKDECYYQLRKDSYLGLGKGYFNINDEGKSLAKNGGYKIKKWRYLTLEPYKEQLGKTIVKYIVGFVLIVAGLLMLLVLKIIRYPFQ